MPIEHSSPSTVTKPTGYSHIARAGNLLFLAGQVAVDSEGRLVGRGDIAAQTRRVFANLSALLRESGARWAEVAKLNIYMTDMRGIDRVRQIRSEVFQSEAIEPPAITTVEVTNLAAEGALIEIEAIAVLS